MKLFTELIISIAVLFLIAACSSDDTTSTCSTATGTVAITVDTSSSGTTPTYSWTVGSVARLTVEDTATSTVIWGLSSSTSNTDSMASPYVHGAGAPSGMALVISSEPALTSGTCYEVGISQGSGSPFGTQEFTAP